MNLYTELQMWKYGRNILQTVLQNLKDFPDITVEEIANHIQGDIDRFDGNISVLEVSDFIKEISANGPPST